MNAKTKKFTDLRFILGIVIIVACVAGGAWLFSNMGATQTVYRFTKDLPVGHQISAEDVTSVEVNLGLAHELYLTEPPAPNQVLLRPATSGELALKSSFGAAENVALSTVVVNLGAPVPSGVKVGSNIELWAVPGDGNQVADPQRVASGAQVSKIITDKTIMSSGKPKLEVKVNPKDLPGLLKWISKEGVLVAVDAHG